MSRSSTHTHSSESGDNLTRCGLIIPLYSNRTLQISLRENTHTAIATDVISSGNELLLNITIPIPPSVFGLASFVNPQTKFLNTINSVFYVQYGYFDEERLYGLLKHSLAPSYPSIRVGSRFVLCVAPPPGSICCREFLPRFFSRRFDGTGHIQFIYGLFYGRHSIYSGWICDTKRRAFLRHHCCGSMWLFLGAIKLMAFVASKLRALLCMSTILGALTSYYPCNFGWRDFGEFPVRLCQSIPQQEML
jgi:hypothetical protein